jgi:hypothetical protein
MKKPIKFSSFEESEKEQLIQSLNMTIEERLEMLKFLQKNKYELDQNRKGAEMLEEVEEKYIVLKKKA